MNKLIYFDEKNEEIIFKENISGDDVERFLMSEKVLLQAMNSLVSTQVNPKQTKKDPSRRFFKIKNEIVELYELIEMFYSSWVANAEIFYPNYSAEEREIVLEAQERLNNGEF